MADNVEIQIKALVQGLADVKALVNEIQKLPGAGAGISNISKEFADVKRELQAATTEIRTVGTQAQASFRSVASGSSGAVKGLRDTSRASRDTKENIAELSQGAAAVGRALQDAFTGNILGALQSVGVALRTSLNFQSITASALPALDKVGTKLADTSKLVTKFSSVLGTAAKNPLGNLSGQLFTDFGIEAERALINPQLAVQKFVSSLALIPDEAGRATAAASIFGASTASLLPTIEALVAAELAAGVAAAEMGAAQTAATAAQARLAAANTAAAAAQARLIVLQQAGVATAGEIAAAESAAAAAATAVTAARSAEALATAALTVAEQNLIAVTGAVIVVEEAATVASIGLAGALSIAVLALGGIVAIAGIVIAAGFGIAKSFSDAGSVIKDISTTTGLAASDIIVLKLAAEQAGSSLEKVTGSFEKYLKNVNEAATGNKTLAKTFTDLGVDAEKGNKDSSAALEQLFVALSKIPPGAQQVNAAMKLAGKSGADLIPIIDQTGGSFVKFKEKAAALGITLTDEAANAADDFGDTLTELQAVMAGIRNEVGAELLPTMLDLARSLSQFLAENRQGIGDLAGVVSGAVTVALGAIYLLGGTIGFLANLIYGLITAVYALVVSALSLAGAVITAGAALSRFIAGDVAGAVGIMTSAVNQTRFAIQGLTDDLARAQTIIASPTFTSFFSLLNGGDGRTSKTFNIPKPKPTGSFRGGGTGGGGKKGGGGGQSDAKALNDALIALEKARLQAQNDLLKDAIKTEQEILKERFDQNLLSYQEYYDQLGATQLRENANQIALQRALIEIEERQLAKVKKGSERVKIETDILKLNTELEILLRNQGNISRRNTEEIRKQAEAYNDMMADIRNQLLELQGEESDAVKNRIEKQFRDQLEKAQARARETGDDKDVKAINRLKELLIATGRFEVAQKRANELIAERDSLEEKLNNQVERGTTSREAANATLKKFEQEQLAGLNDLVAAMQAFADKTGSPELQQAVIDIGIGLEKWSLGQTTRDIDVFKGKLDAAQTALDLRNQELDTAVINGAYTEQQAFEQRKIAIASYADEAFKVLSALEAIAVATKNADLQAYVDRARGDLAGIQADSDDLAISINQGFGGALTGLFSSIAEGTKSGAEAFADFGRSILKVLSDVLVKIIITKLAMLALGGAGGGQGGIGGFLSGLLGGDKAAGGFASGGYTGGSSEDEIRGIVHGKEFVMNADATAQNRALLEQMNAGLNPQRNLAAGSNVSPAASIASGMAQNLKIVNVLPNDLLDNYVTSGDGARAMLNFIDGNVNAINAKLKQ